MVHIEGMSPKQMVSCLSVLRMQVASPAQRRRMHPIVRGSYEPPPWEFCYRRGLFTLFAAIKPAGTRLGNAIAGLSPAWS